MGEPIDTGNENYAQEATIQLGTVYETWADDPLNLGLPVVGRASMVEGAPFWHPYYIANPLPLGQSQPDITDWSGGWPEVPVAV